jgi:hypothetical protein
LRQFSGRTFITRSDTTGSDGKYGFDSLAVGKYSVSLTAVGFTAKSDSVVLTDTVPMTKDMALQPVVYGSISGFITLLGNANDATTGVTPIANAIVTMMQYSGMTIISKTDTTGADGKYGFDSLPTGKYTMIVAATGFVTKTDSATIADTTPVSKSVVLASEAISVSSARCSTTNVVPAIGITGAKSLRLSNFIGAGNVRLYDMNGRLAYSRSFDAFAAQSEIPLHNRVVGGAYVVTVVQKNSVSRFNVIVP